jgi:hypothetical protein
MGEHMHTTEDILRHLWGHQYITTDNLFTIDGRPLSILHPGILNRGSGPDFRDALIVLDGTSYRGDIEFHRSIEDWENHFHENDPHYNTVILHVVFEEKRSSGETRVLSGRSVPVLTLEKYITSPLEKIIEHIARDESVSKRGFLPCYRKNGAVPGNVLEDWVQKLFLERFKEKTDRLGERLVELVEERQRRVSEPPGEYESDQGPPNDIPVPNFCVERGVLNKLILWEQLLYEGIMDGLGYSNNREPFILLSRQLPLWIVVAYRQEKSILELQALYLGSAGLFPAPNDIEHQPARVYLHQLLNLFREDRTGSKTLLNESDWIFAPTRPVNFPTVRLAAAAAIVKKILDEQLFKNIVLTLMKKEITADSMIQSLMSFLNVPDDTFWSYHYTFSESTSRPHTILGITRRNEIIMNTILPLCALYAKVFEKEDLMSHVIAAAFIMKPLEENSILKKMERQVLRARMEVRYACQQQGIIQLFKRYCTADRCRECEIGRRIF